MTLKMECKTFAIKIPFSTLVEYEKEIRVTGTETSNGKVVTIRTPRTCANCLDNIPAGNRSFSFNPKDKPRYWICLSCLPEPNGEPLVAKVGEEGIFYSRYRDKLGNPMDYRTMCNTGGLPDWEDRLEEQIESEAIGLGQD